MKKKILYVALILALCISSIMISPVNAATSDATIYGTVSSLTGSPTITDDENGNMIITFTKTEINELKWVKHDDNGTERGKNGWWLGFKVTAPDNANLDTSTWSDGKNSSGSFSEVLDTREGRDCSFWVLIDENILASHDKTWDAYKYTFNWKNKDDALQPTLKTLNVTIRINPEGAVLNTTPENEANANKIIKVTVDGKIFTMLKGESLSSLPESDKTILDKLKVKEGYTFDGFFKNVDGQDIEVKETEPINEETILTSKFTKIETPQEVTPDDPKIDEPLNTEPEETQVMDNTPKTGSSNIELIYFSIAIVAIATIAGIVAVKKYRK